MIPDEEKLRIIWNQQSSGDSALNSCHRKVYSSKATLEYQIVRLFT
jgi:hypothetical protein